MNNPLTAFPKALNALSGSLEYLDLSQNNITVLQNNGRNFLKNLTYFMIGSSNLQQIEDCAFCSFTKLKQISLSNNNNLSFIHKNAFGAISLGKPIQLDYFSIHSCNISSLSEKLLDWKNVSHIDIRHNPLTCNCSMAWLINDYNASKPLYVNNLQSYFESYKNELRCTNPPELKNEHLYKLSGDFCLNETFDLKKEEKVYQVCGGENDGEIDLMCVCENENLKCTSLEDTNIKILNKTIEIKGIQIILGNITNLNLKKLVPEKQHLIESLHFYHKIGSTLIELDLNFNALKNLPAQTFTHLTKLNVLKLHSNRGIGNSLSSELFSSCLASLEHLDLSDCNITSLKDNVFINLKNLKHLTLSNNPLSTFPTAINSLSSLQIFEISNTDITVFKHAGLKPNKNLKYLYAYSSKLQKIDDCAFCNFPNLKTVDLDHNKKLSFIHENAFGLAHSHRSTALEEFYVNGCNLTVLSENLLNWTSLKKFKASDNPFICDCSMKWVINYVKEKYDSAKHSHYHCQQPTEFEGKTFLELPDSFCNESTTTSSLQISTTTSSTITVTESSTSPKDGILILIIVFLSVAFIICLSVFGGYYFYYRNQRIIQIQKGNEGEEDLLEEDFDTVNF
uniref:LRRCT domain-containing protein n=1 Tax=Panagrolaimus sp. ES5 TaxID=591445 RepID=A0AC34GSY0_9BILA